MTSEKSAAKNGLSPLLGGVRDYYSDKIAAHGPVPAGVDWASHERQERRFAALTRVLPRDGDFSLLDVGCGYGALRDYVQAAGRGGRYTGTDISPAMLEQARSLHQGVEDVFLLGDIPDASFDYVLASGIFNVTAGADLSAWQGHITGTMRRMFDHCRVAMGCNFLSAYSDEDRKAPRLHYADPRDILDFCLRELSLEAELNHHYGTGILPFISSNTGPDELPVIPVSRADVAARELEYMREALAVSIWKTSLGVTRG